MLRFPRVALGTVQPEADSRWLCWSLLELLNRQRLRVQHFFSRCCFTSLDGATTATGLASRHLDSWLMSPELCRQFFTRGVGDCEFALIEGEFDAARPAGAGGSLDTLCEWLNLPRLAVLDVQRLQDCHLPQRPVVDGLLLDRIRDGADFCRWQTKLESLWGIPVLGGMEDRPRLREQISALPSGSLLPREFCEDLGLAASPYLRLDQIEKLAERREFSFGSTEVCSTHGSLDTNITVAVAYDEAFHGYFCDTLEMLEVLGATVVDFSPLHDESLPPDVDLVYIGCGHPEQYSDALAENHCMKAALQNHLCAGQRIYADGGGLAYLCEYIETPEGPWKPMVGVLPARAHLAGLFKPPQPVEVTLAKGNWLGKAGSKLRGYLNPRWRLEASGPLTPYLAEKEHEFDIVGTHQAMGSRMQVNFAAQPDFLRNFLNPVTV